MTPASSLAKSASVVLALNCPSIESRVCSTTSSSASASTMGGMSGCQRLCPVWACCASGLLRSISTIFTVPPNGRVSHNIVTVSIRRRFVVGVDDHRDRLRCHRPDLIQNRFPVSGIFRVDENYTSSGHEHRRVAANASRLLSSADVVERIFDLLEPNGGRILLRLRDNNRGRASGHQTDQYYSPFHGTTAF